MADFFATLYMAIHSVDAWCFAHPLFVAFLVGYVTTNILPRIPKPSNSVLAVIVDVIDCLCVLSGDRWVGSLKMPGTSTTIASKTLPTIPVASSMATPLDNKVVKPEDGTR